MDVLCLRSDTLSERDPALRLCRHPEVFTTPVLVSVVLNVNVNVDIHTSIGGRGGRVRQDVRQGPRSRRAADNPLPAWPGEELRYGEGTEISQVLR